MRHALFRTWQKYSWKRNLFFIYVRELRVFSVCSREGQKGGKKEREGGKRRERGREEETEREGGRKRNLILKNANYRIVFAKINEDFLV